MNKTTTDCCALAQLSGLDNYTSENEIKHTLDFLRKEAEEISVPGSDTGKGQRAYFVITTPNEHLLEEKLIKSGFACIHSFNRRIGYPEGKLKMYIVNL